MSEACMGWDTGALSVRLGVWTWLPAAMGGGRCSGCPSPAMWASPPSSTMLSAPPPIPITLPSPSPTPGGLPACLLTEVTQLPWSCVELAVDHTANLCYDTATLWCTK